MAEESPVDFGSFLKHARETRGLSLQQVAATTKISARVLAALERNDASKLPGGIFSRAFVRAFAREVGLDPESAVSRFVAAFPDESGAVDGPKPAGGEDLEAFESRRKMVATLLQLLGFSLLIVVVALLYYNRRGSPKPPAELPQKSTTSAPAPPSASPQPVVPSPSMAEPQVPGSAPARSLSVVLGASEACWIAVTADGVRVAERTLQAGDRVEYQARGSLTLSVGNAGALSITINGKPARSWGARGQVVSRVITLDTLNAFLQ
jgi:cytoskeletal protein RodZ